MPSRYKSIPLSGGCAGPEGSRPLHPLIGTWRLVACEHELADGRVTRPFGFKPKGRLVYTAEGRIMVILMDPRRPPCRRHRQLFEADDAELAASARGFVAYSGRWKVVGGKVVHSVDLSLFPNWIGTRQVREFRVKGDRVSFTTRMFEVHGVAQRARLVWKREATPSRSR